MKLVFILPFLTVLVSAVRESRVRDNTSGISNPFEEDTQIEENIIRITNPFEETEENVLQEPTGKSNLKSGTRWTDTRI